MSERSAGAVMGMRRRVVAALAAGLVIVIGSAGGTTAQTTHAAARSGRPGSLKPAAAASPRSSAATTTDEASASVSEDVIGRVGNSSLTGNDIRAYVASLPASEQAQLEQNPALLSQAVRALLAGRLVLQRVTAEKWDQQPQIAAQLERVRENALVELYLQSVSNPPASFPTDEDVRKVYDANREAFLMPRQFDLAQIFVPLAKGADKAAEENARKRVEDIQRKLKGGADFAALATESGASNGGDLGWVAEPQIRPEIRTQVMGLGKNAVSEPIKLDDGWHTLKLIDTKASYTRTLLEVRDQLVQRMRAERAAELRRAYIAELLKQTPPAINEIALSKVLDEGGRAKQ